MSQQIATRRQAAAESMTFEQQMARVRELKSRFLPQAKPFVFREPAPEPEIAPEDIPAVPEIVVPEDDGRATPERLIKRVADEHGLAFEDLVGPVRDAHIVAARHEAIAAVHAAFDGLSYEALGIIFRRNHATIIHALRRQGQYTAGIARPTKREWSEDEKQALRDLWPTEMSATEIGRRIGRSKPAVLSKAVRLGLTGRAGFCAPAERERRKKVQLAFLARMKPAGGAK